MIDRLDFADLNEPVLDVFRGSYKDTVTMVLRLSQNLESNSSMRIEQLSKLTWEKSIPFNIDNCCKNIVQ